MDLTFKRNLKSLENKTGNKIKNALNTIISEHERCKKSYFWKSFGNAAQRRKNEFCNELNFVLNNTEYVIVQEMTQSCKNVYFSTHIELNDEKKNITALKKLVN